MTPSVTDPPDPDRTEPDPQFDPRTVRMVYQPICELTTRLPVAFEALARGPAGTPLADPEELFAAATRSGRVAELDWSCRAAAMDGALRAGLDRTVSLFVNVEPVTLDAPCPPHLRAVVTAAQSRLRVVTEFTERDLASRPASVISVAAAARRHGWGVALDDVGTEPASLALLPFLHPDVVKLDRRLVQQRSEADVAGIVTAVLSYAERSGAAILAEGIETEEHLAVALTYGATLGQGWLLGRPAPLPAVLPRSETPMPALRPPSSAATPYQVVAAARPPRRAEKRLLLGLSHHLENKAYGLGSATVVLACFQHARHFTPDTRRRYARLREAAVLVGAIGSGMAAEPVAGVRGAQLRPDDPLIDEWTVIVVAPHYAAALVARDCGDDGPDPARRFDYCVTHDRRLVLAAATSLMSRLLPQAGAVGPSAVPNPPAQRLPGHLGLTGVATAGA